jgi:hypothetical protein
MRGQNGNALMARLAARGKGVVTRRALLTAGMDSTAIDRRIASGMLRVVYPGTYRVGHAAPSTEASYMAAVLACGEEAVLSGLAAAWLWGLTQGRPPRPEVSAPTKRRIEGLTTRRRRLHPGEKTRRHGIPITAVPLTLLDLSPSLSSEDLARACHEAGVKHRTTPREVKQAVARRPNAKGAAKLRAVLEGDEPLLLSKLEERFLDLLRAHNLPLPLTNRPRDGHFVDCRWPEHRLTVELDSFRFHNSRYAWERDRKRERAAYARGDQFRRFTWGDVFETPAVTLDELRGLLVPAA